MNLLLYFKMKSVKNINLAVLKKVKDYNIIFMTTTEFQQAIQEGIPAELPTPKPYDPIVNHAPKRKAILTKEEKKLAVRNALRYFEPRHHAVLAKEFAEELEKYGRIYMYRFRFLL